MPKSFMDEVDEQASMVKIVVMLMFSFVARGLPLTQQVYLDWSYRETRICLSFYHHH